MKVFFILLLLANAGYFTWQLSTQPTAGHTVTGPLTIDSHTPPLVLLNELPSQPPPAAGEPREPSLQELPPDDAPAPAP